MQPTTAVMQIGVCLWRALNVTLRALLEPCTCLTLLPAASAMTEWQTTTEQHMPTHLALLAAQLLLRRLHLDRVAKRICDLLLLLELDLLAPFRQVVRRADNLALAAADKPLFRAHSARELAVVRDDDDAAVVRLDRLQEE